jgi:hypothetical protein
VGLPIGRESAKVKGGGCENMAYGTDGMRGRFGMSLVLKRRCDWDERFLNRITAMLEILCLQEQAMSFPSGGQ